MEIELGWPPYTCHTRTIRDSFNDCGIATIDQQVYKTKIQTNLKKYKTFCHVITSKGASFNTKYGLLQSHETVPIKTHMTGQRKVATNRYTWSLMNG